MNVFVRTLIIVIIGFVILAYGTQFVVLHLIPESFLNDPDFDERLSKIIGSVSAVYMISAGFWLFHSAKAAKQKSQKETHKQNSGPNQPVQ